MLSLSSLYVTFVFVVTVYSGLRIPSAKALSDFLAE